MVIIITNCVSNLHVKPNFVVSPQGVQAAEPWRPLHTGNMSAPVWVWRVTEKCRKLQRVFFEIGAGIPPFKNYLEKNIVPWPADWPGWYYPKKNVAQGKCQLLQQSVLPEQGQFHVSLNTTEDNVSIFKCFFDDLYKSVFGQDLPNKSRTYKVRIIIIYWTAALLGWIQIPKKVLQKFATCKHHEFVTVTYLLEDMLPLVFFQNNIFCSGDPLEYENFWWLEWLSSSFAGGGDIIINQLCNFAVTWNITKMFLLGCWSKKLEHFSLITEKGVEVFHSILQEQSMEHDDGSFLFQTAKVIASCSFLSTFKACFFPFCQRDVSDINLRLVTGKTAGFL